MNEFQNIKNKIIRGSLFNILTGVPIGPSLPFGPGLPSVPGIPGGPGNPIKTQCRYYHPYLGTNFLFEIFNSSS